MSGTKPEKEKNSRFKALKNSLSAWVHGAGMRCLLLMAVGCVALFALCCTVFESKRYSFAVGDIADRNIVATQYVEDTLATEAARNKAAEAIGPISRRHDTVTQEILDDLDAVLAEMKTVQEYGRTLRARSGVPSGASQSFTAEDIAFAQQQVTRMKLDNYRTNILMNADDNSFEAFRSSLRSAVEAELRAGVPVNGESKAITSIYGVCSSEMSGDKLNSAIRPVLDKIIRANMLVDEMLTEQARERARAEEPAVGYAQGSYIVRVGDSVTENQISMLDELGLLTSSGFNFSLSGGALLMVVCAMALLWMLLRLLEPSALKDIRTMLVILLVMLITQGLSAISITLINAYLSPVALCAILLTGLLGPRIGAAAGLTMTMIVAGLSAASSNSYSTEMVCLILTGLAGSAVAVHFLAGKPQRVSAVICGAIVALANLLIMIAIGLMTAVHLESTISGAIWAIAGGLLSGLIAVGFQPVFEAVFNLATPSKLMELANPNHPLLRRLLMEAPGTYHHSIIVANLAEAAAERIGANMLLTRAGAYFHDVGKLKRPMYFKENQHGDNPHDRTTAHLSAAIVTAHTRDGVALAQKHRLPQEIQRIILEHHGDTPVMYFYHKALQQADGKPVDVKDFRYSGNRPGTKESAIVMLADTIEAAVRSMSEPTPQAIQRFIERLVRGKIEDGQLSDSPLSLHDIDGICEAFIKVLRGVFHERIEYPTVHIERLADTEPISASAASESVPEKPAVEKLDDEKASEEKLSEEKTFAENAPEDAAAKEKAEESDLSEGAAPYSAPMPDGIAPSEDGEEEAGEAEPQ